MPAQDGDVIGVSVKHRNSESGDQINKFQFRISATAPVAEADVLDDIKEIIEAVYLLYEAWISIRNLFVENVVTNETQGLLYGSVDAGTYVGGLSADPAMPQGTAAYIYFKTAVPRVILSKYLPSANAASVNADGRVHSAQQTALAAWGVLLTATHVFSGRDYTYGYNSPKALGFVVPVLQVVSNVYGYQRRRKAGRGS